MKAQIINKSLIGASAIFLACFSIDWSIQNGVSVGITPAEARIGRPATPISGAGYARRHGDVYRHTNVGVHRHTNVIYRAPVGAAVIMGGTLMALPSHCVSVEYNFTQYHRCGSTYYQRSGTGYIAVAPPR